MAIDAIRASQAYANVARIAADAPRADATQAAAKPDFANLVQNAVSQTAAALNAGEAAAAQVAAGDANLVDVVTAVSAAEASLETALAVRNKVIEAYQEIMRMPI
jgi:flagellar hook-basal body complex protein FliE